MNYKPYGKLLDPEPPVLPPIGARNLWLVMTDCRYVTRDGWLVTLRKNELSDLASIPRIFRIFFGGDGKETLAALFHDHCYKYRKERIHVSMGTATHILTWREANYVMHDIMILSGVSWLRRKAIMSGLWVGSHFVWASYDK